MAKLTRYTSFKALKSDVQPATATAAERAQAQAAFKEFIVLLQRERARGQQQTSSDERAGG